VLIGLDILYVCDISHKKEGRESGGLTKIATLKSEVSYSARIRQLEYGMPKADDVAAIIEGKRFFILRI